MSGSHVAGISAAVVAAGHRLEHDGTGGRRVDRQAAQQQRRQRLRAVDEGGHVVAALRACRVRPRGRRGAPPSPRTSRRGRRAARGSSTMPKRTSRARSATTGWRRWVAVTRRVEGPTPSIVDQRRPAGPARASARGCRRSPGSGCRRAAATGGSSTGPPRVPASARGRRRRSGRAPGASAARNGAGSPSPSTSSERR